jgi:succinyldiaminopimelate transaminase
VTTRRTAFVPPTYPFDKLGELHELAGRHDGGAVDLSIGTPCDPPPDAVVAALASSGTERGYPTSLGSLELREAAASWIERRFAVSLEPAAVGACVGTKELVAGVPHWLRLRSPERDTVLFPELAYPTYEMGAILAGCRAVPVPIGHDGRLDLSSVSDEDAGRALVLWVNSPANPAGSLDDLGAAAAWGRANRVPVFSDECYVEFTWSGPPSSILQSGCDGVVAVHSLSKRSNLAGLRVGFYAGDPELVGYLAALRRHAGFMVPGPVQHAAAVALEDDGHVAAQRERYLERLELLSGALAGSGLDAEMPKGAFYLWVPATASGSQPGVSTESPGFALGRALALEAGVVVSPGEAYGPAGRSHVRLAVVQPTERLRLVAGRLAGKVLTPEPAAST